MKPPRVSEAEAELLNQTFTAFDQLRKMGWREAVYAPKDTPIEVIEPGSTGIFRGTRTEEGFWAFDGGDTWPSRAILYRLVPS